MDNPIPTLSFHPVFQECDQEMLKTLFHFIYERQSIWYKRFILNQEAPWTDDAVLQKWKFTNVRRILDRGTIYFLDYLKTNPQPLDVLWNSMRYRLFNNKHAHLALGSWESWKDFDFDQWYKGMRSLHGTGATILSDCHNTCCPVSFPGEDKIAKLAWALQQAHQECPELLKRIESISLLAQWGDITAVTHTLPMKVWESIKQTKGYGAFLSYEVYTDLCYCSWFPWTDDVWANPGPGCMKGLNIVFPGREDYLPLLKWTRDHQQELFDMYGYDWKKVAYKQEMLTLRDVEHTYCEYQGYRKAMLTGRGKFGGTYRPSTMGTLDYNTLSMTLA